MECRLRQHYMGESLMTQLRDIKLGLMVVLIVQFISVIGVIYLIGEVC